MLSKGSVAVLPVLLLILIAWKRKITWRDGIRLVPFFLIGGGLAVVNVWFQTHGEEAIRQAGWIERFLGAGGAVWFYLYKAMLPFHLSFVYPLWKIDATNLLWWIPLAGVAATTAIFWFYRRSWWRPFWFAWSFFLVALLPALGLVDVGFMKFSLIADRYQHIAILGVVVLAVGCWERWRLGGVAREVRFAPLAVATAVLGIMAMLSWQRADLFSDAVRLYEETLLENPKSILVYNNLGTYYGRKNQPEKALEYFQKAIDLNPGFLDSLSNAGKIAMDSGRLDKAIEYFQKGVAANPTDARAYSNLALGYHRKGDWVRAEELYRKSIGLQEALIDSRLGLAATLDALGRYYEAVKQFEAAATLAPNSPLVFNNWGNVLDKSGKLTDATEKFEHAVKIAPGDYLSRSNLGILYMRTGRKSEATEQWKKAVAIRPDDLNAHLYLGMSLFEENQIPAAIEQFQFVLNVDPRHADARLNLASALHKSGRTPEALQHLHEVISSYPNALGPYLLLGTIYAEEGRGTEVAAVVQKAQEIAKKSGNTDAMRRVEAWKQSLGGK